MECAHIAVYGDQDLSYYAPYLMEEVFWEHRLSLFCRVPVSDLASADGRAAPLPEDGRISLLICRGDTALLAVLLPPTDQDRGVRPDGIPGLLTLELTDTRRDNHYSTIRQSLYNLLGRDIDYPWRFLGRPVPPGRLETLRQSMLIQHVIDNWEEPPEPHPTDYGIDLGLVEGYTFTDGGSCVAGVWSSPRTDANLDKILARQSAQARTSGPLPFAQRLSQLARRPLAGDIEAVRRFANTRLDDYMKGFPEDLAKLRDCLPTLGPDATYQDAAVIIYWLLQTEPERPEGLRRELEQYPESGHAGGSLFWHLTRPLLSRLDRNR